MIPISKYVVDDETKHLVNQVLESGQLSQGPMVEEAEQLIADISNCKYAVCVANGTIALEAMLRVAPIKKDNSYVPKNEDIHIGTSPLTFRATIKAIEHAGYKPWFMDIEEDSLCLELDDSSPITGPAMPIDLYGRKANFNWHQTYGDAAQGIGLDLSDRRASALSFYTTKNVGCGEGGAVVTNSKNIADNIHLLRNQGMSDGYHYHLTDGYNWRMTELSAAVMIPQLKKIKLYNGLRFNHAWDYYKAFEDLPVTLPVFPEDPFDCVWHQFTLRHPKRDEIVTRLKKADIQAKVYYPQLVSPKEDWEKTPIALKASQEVFSIPVHDKLTDGEVNQIIESVIDIVAKISE